VMFFLLITSIFLLSCRLFYLFLGTVGDGVLMAPSPNASLIFSPFPLSLSSLHLTHSNACNIGSTARNSSIEQPIGVWSVVAYYSTQYFWQKSHNIFDRKADQGASFMRFVGEKVVFPTFPLWHPLKCL
jgi:hypothetical protein